MKNLLFYKFVHLDDREQLKAWLVSLGQREGLKGKILLAEEGINANVTGEDAAVERFVESLCTDERFADIHCKRTHTKRHNFKRFLVKYRDEIITFERPVKMSTQAPHVSPEQLKAWLEQQEDVVLLDTRNTYEHEEGKFQHAITLDLDHFSAFPEHLKELEPYKNKTIVTYCTGGIRCEKAARYLKEQGFSSVYQLEGGILNYGQSAGSTYWEGKCFVFDNRGSIAIDPEHQQDPEEQCVICFIPHTQRHTCQLCEREFIGCSRCVELMQGCCSKFCRNCLRKGQPAPYKPTAHLAG